MLNRFVFISLALLFVACQKTVQPRVDVETEDYVLDIPLGFPQPDIPADNALTKSRVALGRLLFFDPTMSKDSSRSCASCHTPYLAFSDSTATSLGIENRLGTRNSPSLANVVYQKKLLREGSVPTLEMQVSVPIQEHNEFNSNVLEIVDRLTKRLDYVSLAQKAYGRVPDAFVMTRAIAAFERTLISGNAPFDKWFFQNPNTAVSVSVKNGYALFNSEKLNCGKCHEGFLFTNQTFTNNGLYASYADVGRFRLTGLETDKAVFKVPSLRNVALTAPYMHDGQFKTLEQVIDHYQTGGKPHPNKNTLLKPFTLTPQEKLDVLAFLASLTDQNFIDKSK